MGNPGIFGTVPMSEVDQWIAAKRRVEAKQAIRAAADKAFRDVWVKRNFRESIRPKRGASISARLKSFKARRKPKIPVLSEHQQRRSRIDWYGLLPREVAASQIRFERRETVIAMRDAGLTLTEIGSQFGLSRERIRQMETMGRRCRRHPRAMSPAEAHWMKTEGSEAKKSFDHVLPVMTKLSGKPRDWLYV